MMKEKIMTTRTTLKDEAVKERLPSQTRMAILKRMMRWTMTQDVEEQEKSKENDDIVPAKSTSEANEDCEEKEDNKDYHRNVRH